MLFGFKIKQHFTSMKHPQANGQVESANKVILPSLKKRLDKAKGLWADKLDSILWAYWTTVHSTTRETPFKLTYGADAVIPVEIRKLSLRLVFLFETVNQHNWRSELDLLPEVHEEAQYTKKH